jgi:hypothetical protein
MQKGFCSENKKTAIIAAHKKIRYAYNKNITRNEYL